MKKKNRPLILSEHSGLVSGQSQMMEYLLLTVLVIAVILALMIFLSWWQVSQLRVERSGIEQDMAFSLLKEFACSPYMTKENSMFDDGKLTVLSAIMPGACERLQKVYGMGWHAEVSLFDGMPVIDCSQATYPDKTHYCNHWSICPKQDSKGKISLVLPVNIYRRIGMVINYTEAVLPRVYTGLLNVTYYVG